MKKIFIILFIFFTYFTTTFWYNKTEVEVFYNKYYSKLEKSFPNNEDKINKLKIIDEKISKSLSKTKNQKNIELLKQLKELNKQKLVSLKIIKTKSIVSTEKNSKKIYELTQKWYNFIKLSKNYEFEKNWTFKIIFKQFYEVNDNNYQTFLNKLYSDYLVELPDWNLIIPVWVQVEKKYSYKELETLFSHFSDKTDLYFLEWWIYYNYKYKLYNFFKDNYWVYLSDLSSFGITPEKTILVKDNDKYLFVNDYQKIKLVSQNLLNDISNKKEFLNNLSDDQKFLVDDYENILINIRDLSKQLTKDAKNDEEKISILYWRNVKNLNYFYDYNKSDNIEIYSWVLTFKNKIWVCDWYTKLFSYMLLFSWINDVEVKKWFVFDHVDFPTFWHAWVKIWQNYYDPTFDNTILSKQKEFDNNYKYYKLPYDLIYTNRFDWLEIPTNLELKTLEERKKISLENMYKVFDKYKNQNYEILKKVKNRVFINAKPDTIIDINYLTKNLPFYEVNNFSYLDDLWYKIYIRWIEYYPLNQQNIDTILSLVDFEKQNIVIYKWTDKNWNTDYRLAYNVDLTNNF